MNKTPPSSVELPVETQCPNCGAQSTTDYVLLGTTIQCRDCNTRVAFAVRPGSIYPLTGTHITYSSFLSLLSREDSQGIFSEKLAQWFGLRVVGQGPATEILSGDHQSIDILTLHRQIQANERQRGEFYNAAMDIWHS